MAFELGDQEITLFFARIVHLDNPMDEDDEVCASEFLFHLLRLGE